MGGRYDNLIAREAYRLLFQAKRLPHRTFRRDNIAPTDQIAIIPVDPRDGYPRARHGTLGPLPELPPRHAGLSRLCG
jgi:hypothetical protein